LSGLGRNGVWIGPGSCSVRIGIVLDLRREEPA
jgi:hypothetical protein